ncbi:natterin-3-like [Anolis sagrei]|uniref:natterin-3-like n=1 Tax=Anolis sagrei TaxID=38937 RepID=UPI0035211886
MDFRMHLLFCALFISLLDYHCISGQECVLTSLKKTVEKGPLVTIVQNGDSSSAVNPTRNNRHNDVFYETTLKWVWFNESAPSEALSFWNSYANRWEYPCWEERCAAGFYSPTHGPYCYYAYGNGEFSTSNFQVLVNEHDFESLKWQQGSYGSVPQNSVDTCPGAQVYVGKNKYGLGKVDVQNSAFFIGINGKEYWYKYYDVLTIYKGYRSQEINNVKYMKDQGIYSNDALTLFTAKVTNNNCDSVKKITTLSKTVSFEHHWDVGIALSQSVNTTITVGIPQVIGTSWGFSSEKTFNWNKGSTQTEAVTFTETVEIDVPPNHSCEVTMEGITMKARFPFTARATRYYNNGESRSAIIQGVSNSGVVTQVHTESKRCQPIPDAEPCLSEISGTY